MNLITKKNGFKSYQLLDSGEGQKLEIISGIRVARPSPQAIWNKKLNPKEWQMASSVCLRTKGGGGEWKHQNKAPQDMELDSVEFCPLKLKLKLTPFGHCGIFFEQLPVWEWLFHQVQSFKRINKRAPIVANLFGYTGAASIVMAYAGAHVYHVDSAKGVLEWGQENEKINKLSSPIHWVHEDAQRFLVNSYNKKLKLDGVLLDPPSWGHGTKKEVWEFEKNIASLLDKLFAILQEKNSFMFFSSHTHGVQAEAIHNLLKQRSFFKLTQSGDLLVEHHLDGRLLPAGVYTFGSNLA